MKDLVVVAAFALVLFGLVWFVRMELVYWQQRREWVQAMQEARP